MKIREWISKEVMELFYQRIIKKIRVRFKTLYETATVLNEFAKTKGMKTYIKAQNVDGWIKGSIPSGDYAKILEMYLYENFTANEFLEVLNIKEGEACDIISENLEEKI